MTFHEIVVYYLYGSIAFILGVLVDAFIECVFLKRRLTLTGSEFIDCFIIAPLLWPIVCVMLVCKSDTMIFDSDWFKKKGEK